MTESSLGIMGGTFDPVHYGHLVAAEAARSEFGLDRVVFVPAGSPPHKKDYSITTAEHRYLMTVLAVANNHYFDASRLEIDRGGYSYAVDTVREFQQRTKAGLYFITGADAILEILSWKNVFSLLEMCSFIAATRPGYKLEDFNFLLDRLPPVLRSKIFPLEVPALAISSSDIRSRVQAKKPIKYLLPEAVEYYIYKNSLYKDCGEKG